MVGNLATVEIGADEVPCIMRTVRCGTSASPLRRAAHRPGERMEAQHWCWRCPLQRSGWRRRGHLLHTHDGFSLLPPLGWPRAPARIISRPTKASGGPTTAGSWTRAIAIQMTTVAKNSVQTTCPRSGGGPPCRVRPTSDHGPSSLALLQREPLPFTYSVARANGRLEAVGLALGRPRRGWQHLLPAPGGGPGPGEIAGERREH